MTNNAIDLDSIDWSQYPPERVEGLKLFHRSPSSEEDGEPTEEELKSLCLKWECRVDMTIDNFVFWTLEKTKKSKFNGDKERFKQAMPKLFRIIRRVAMGKYERYQNANAEMHKQYLQQCAEWRKNELRRIRYLDKLREICSTWTNDDSSDTDNDDESSYGQNVDNVNIAQQNDN